MTFPVSKWTEFALASGGRLLAIIIIALLLNRFLSLITKRLVKLASSDTRVALMREQQSRTLTGVLYSAGTMVILVVAFLMALPLFGISVTPIAALAGLATVGLGFGAQNLVRDLINGFFIVFEDQFVVGDMIRAGDTVGRVEHLTLRRTVLRDLQGSLVTIPNGEIRQVGNLSRDWSQLFVDVQVSADDTMEKALGALEKVCAELRADAAWSPALVDGPRLLGVEALNLSGATLRIQLRTVPTRQHDVARELRRRIQARLAQEQISLDSVQKVELVGSDQDTKTDSGPSR